RPEQGLRPGGAGNGGRRQAGRRHRPAARRGDPRPARRGRRAFGYVLPRVPRRSAARSQKWHAADRRRPGAHRLTGPPDRAGHAAPRRAQHVEDEMPKTRKVGNLLALAVLSYLTAAPMHPYELGRTLRDNGDARSIKFNQGSLYMVIQQLAKAGYVTEVETTREGQRPERTVYALTDAGRQEFRDWLRDLVAEPKHEYPQFVAALSLIAALPPSEVVPLLRHRLDRLASQRAEIQGLIDRTLAEGVPALFVVE